MRGAVFRRAAFLKVQKLRVMPVSLAEQKADFPACTSSSKQNSPLFRLEQQRLRVYRRPPPLRKALKKRADSAQAARLSQMQQI